MKNAKHSPVPWSRDSGESLLVYDANGLPVATVGESCDKEDAECLADWQLVAAAPDLLNEVNEGELFAAQLAREFRAFARMDPNDSRIREGFARLQKACEVRAGFFRAAIAKAEGRA